MAPGAQQSTKVGQRLCLGQCGDRVEALGVELQEIALVVMEGEAPPRLAPEPHGRVALEPADSLEPFVHTRSNWATMVFAARERRGLRPWGFFRERARAAVARASRSRVF